MSNKQRIIIVGGGTAGWMTAGLLNHRLSASQFEITVIESADIGVIGVGEGSTPQLKTFFDLLSITEAEWMPACHATYKNGIQFNQWTQDKPRNHYFHPFPSATDRDTARTFLLQSHYAQQGSKAAYHPDDYFLAAHLAKQGKSPVSATSINLNYAYHFDSLALGKFIRDTVVARGVKHTIATVQHVNLKENGDIQSVVTQCGKALSAEWFFDCSGFNGLLIQKTLGTHFVSFKDNLFNNAAVALATPADSEPCAYTSATALSCGWAWHIPLTHRNGNGYVYSSDFCCSDEAETELRKHLGLLDADVTARHLTMNVGRCENTWVNNCIAVGLSQGFIEPLEATALHIVQETVIQFIGAFEAGHYSRQHQRQFNDVINARIDGIRDYIVCHYQVSNRNDSAYWRANTQNQHRSISLQMLLDVWQRGGDLAGEVARQQIGHYYPAISWLCLLTGYAHLPAYHSLAPVTPAIAQQLQQLSEQFMTHPEALRALS
ncbi:tryptophan halogenase family protein [Alteromonas oceanisediminis]|uniref:tryptophan halogenase family protein n=1 Tax=Alteromonas oceanisediminis TaxID=2836180 RepID=UPI001BDA70A0|nr:tryptophan halogenase family protein [Alteromonas oceanisediminis]MBT0586454.1 tryptophan 7-halogenase [Alteromonas oceanisediminis]